MRTVVIALATIAILTAPAYSQTGGKRSKQSGSEQQTAEKKKKADDLDKAYKAALDKIPEKMKNTTLGEKYADLIYRAAR